MCIRDRITVQRGDVRLDYTTAAGDPSVDQYKVTSDFNTGRIQHGDIAVIDSLSPEAGIDFDITIVDTWADIGTIEHFRLNFEVVDLNGNALLIAKQCNAILVEEVEGGGGAGFVLLSDTAQDVESREIAYQDDENQYINVSGGDKTGLTLASFATDIAANPDDWAQIGDGSGGGGGFIFLDDVGRDVDEGEIAYQSTIYASSSNRAFPSGSVKVMSISISSTGGVVTSDSK